MLTVNAEIGLFFLVNVFLEDRLPHLFGAQEHILQVGLSHFLLYLKLVRFLHLNLCRVRRVHM
jgi:hypothetical protein